MSINNVGIFNAALAGVMAGMTRNVSDPLTNTYLLTSQEAAAFATEVDSLIPTMTVGPTIVQQAIIEGLSETMFAFFWRQHGSVTPADYATIAGVVITAYTQANAQSLAQTSAIILGAVDSINLSGTKLLDIPNTAFDITKAGAQVWVRTIKQWCDWVPDSTATVDQITVIKPTFVGGGAGRFIRRDGGHLSFRQQTTWKIDTGVLGNNENDGLTDATPLADGDELGRRWGTGQTISSQVTVTVNSPGNVSFSCDIKIDHTGMVLVTSSAAAKTVTSGTITSFTPIVTAYGSAAKAITTTAGTNFATLVGRKLRITNGARLDARSIVDADNGGNSCKSTTWLVPIANRFGTVSLVSAPTRVTPQNGDTFDAYTCPTLVGGPLKIQVVQGPTGGSSDPANAFILEDVDTGLASPTRRFIWTSDVDLKPIGAISSTFNRNRIYGCPNGLVCISCSVTSLQLYGTEFIQLGGNSASITLEDTAQVYGDFDHYKNGTWSFASMGCGLFLGTLGDFSTQGIAPLPGNTAQVKTILDSTNRVWGQVTGGGNAWTSWSGSSIVYADKTLLTLKGAINDIVIGGDIKTYADLPYFNVTRTGAMVLLA